MCRCYLSKFARPIGGNVLADDTLAELPYDDGELQMNSVDKEYLTSAADGKGYLTKHYSLDMIIAVGYRVRSGRGTQFRQWATAALAEYLTKGIVLDDARLKEARNWGADYFDELLV